MIYIVIGSVILLAVISFGAGMLMAHIYYRYFCYKFLF